MIEDTVERMWAGIETVELALYELNMSVTIPRVRAALFSPIPMMGMDECSRSMLSSRMSCSDTNMSSDPGSISKRAC